MDRPVFSRREAVEITSSVTGRRFTVAPLTFQQRAQFRSEMARAGGAMPSQAQMRDGLAVALRELSPGNAEELIAVVDEAAAAGVEATEAQRAHVATIQASCAAHPAYSGLAAAQALYLSMLPFVAARFALRGWAGDDLPEFRQVRGAVPEELMEALLPDEIEEIGWQAHALMMVNKVAEGNSASPSSSPATPEPASEG